MDQILNPDQLGERWEMSRQALAQQRYAGRGPKFFRVGRRVFYRVKDIVDWEESQLRIRTDDQPAT